MTTRNRQQDLEKLATEFFKNLRFDDSAYLGSWGLNQKRPFGNSDAERDILDIIGFKHSCPNCGFELDVEPQEEYSESALEYARSLYKELGPYLKIRWEQLTRLELSVSDKFHERSDVGHYS